MFGVFFAEIEINNKPVNLVLDTGASFTVLSPEAAKRVGLTAAKGSSAKLRSASGKYVGAKFAQTKRMSIGDAWTENEFVLVTKVPPEARDGVLGLATLVDWDLRIDLVKKKLMIFPAGKAPTLDGAKVLKMTVIRDESYPQGFQLQGIRVPMTVGKHQLLGVLDTGDSGTVSLTEAWVEKNDPDIMKGVSAEPTIGIDISGVIESYKTKLPIFHFGSDKFRNFPVELSKHVAEVGNELQPRIGIQLLRHYVMTISFSKNEFRLKSLGTVQDLIKISKKPNAGISFRFAEDGGAHILHVKSTGIAALAGLKAGDEVLEMGGLLMKTITPEQLEGLKKLPVVKVRYRRGDEKPAEVDLVFEQNK